MNKLYLLSLLFILSLKLVYAQSNTFTIEENLSKPEKLLPTVSPNILFSRVDKNFLKLSVTGELVELGTHPVITGYLKAYQNHYPITISPDIIWLLICQGFSRHVTNNSEELRSLFVNFENKKTLEVVREVDNRTDISDFPWESVFPDFTKQISAYTGNKLINNLTPDFSTTTPASLIAGQISIMESMRNFFNYKVTMVGCGISEITIEGTLNDWEKIDKRLDFLSRYNLSWWTSELKPIIAEIIKTKKGKLNKEFWMNMIKYHKLGFYGSYDGIDGWLLKFYPYKGNGQRSDFKEIKSASVLPSEILTVPFILELRDKANNIINSRKLEFWAGFMGLKQDTKTFNVKPEIGWAVNQQSK